jgi:hypothetical protein
MNEIAILSGFAIGAIGAIVGMTGVPRGHATLGHVDWNLPGALLIGSRAAAGLTGVT